MLVVFLRLGVSSCSLDPRVEPGLFLLHVATNHPTNIAVRNNVGAACLACRGAELVEIMGAEVWGFSAGSRFGLQILCVRSRYNSPGGRSRVFWGWDHTICRQRSRVNRVLGSLGFEAIRSFDAATHSRWRNFEYLGSGYKPPRKWRRALRGKRRIPLHWGNRNGGEIAICSLTPLAQRPY